MDKTIKIFSRVVKRYFSDGVARASAQLAYYLFFSIFPVLILINDIISRFNIDIIQIIQRVENLFPPQMTEIIVDYLEYLGRIDAPYVFAVALFTTLYAMTRSFNSLLTSVRQAYRIKKAGIINYLTAAIMSAVLLLMFFLLSVVLMGGEFVLLKLDQYIHMSPAVISFIRLLKFVLLPGIVFLFLSAFYYIVPSRRYSLKYAFPGALLGVVGLTVVTYIFSYYVSHFSNYSILYGSIAAVMILMIWLHLVSTILILGGELNDVIIEMHSDHFIKNTDTEG